MAYVALIDLPNYSGGLNWVIGSKWLWSSTDFQTIDLSFILTNKMLLVENRTAAFIQTEDTMCDLLIRLQLIKPLTAQLTSTIWN